MGPNLALSAAHAFDGHAYLLAVYPATNEIIAVVIMSPSILFLVAVDSARQVERETFNSVKEGTGFQSSRSSYPDEVDDDNAFRITSAESSRQDATFRVSRKTPDFAMMYFFLLRP